MQPHRQSKKEPHGRQPRSGGLTPQWHRRPAVRFLILFLPVICVFYVVWLTPWFRENILAAILRFNATVAAGLLALLGQGTTSAGTRIEGTRFLLDIKRGCDAVEPSALFSAAVFAFPVPGGKRVAGILAGIACLIVLNLFRIVSLFFVGAYFPKVFHMVHVDGWQALFILITLFLWIAWARWALRGAQPADVPT